MSKRFRYGVPISRLSSVYTAMVVRCTDPRSINYFRYGGRGIKVCDEWLRDRSTFYEWALGNGYADGLSIDRINNDDGYSPDNCRWTDQKTQTRNTSRAVRVTFQGRRVSLMDLCEKYGINYGTIYTRIRRGRPFDIEKMIYRMAMISMRRTLQQYVFFEPNYEVGYTLS